jgi:murein DD-endopeptidase MepM/ murein hydrolase activator NlpD
VKRFGEIYNMRQTFKRLTGLLLVFLTLGSLVWADQWVCQVGTSVKQGQSLKITVSPGKHGRPVLASLLNQTARLYPQPDGTLEGYIPVGVLAKTGASPVQLLDDKGNVLDTQSTVVQPGYFRVQNIRVSKATKGLEPLPGEMAAIQGLKSIKTPTRFWSMPFVSPTPDCENSPFGVLRAHNGKLTGDYHKGVDLRSPLGRPIKATAAGRVLVSQPFRLHGGTVGLDHGQGISSVYIHLSKRLVQEGDVVEAGQTIGLVGATGFATGPHLHWGIYVNGLPVNPNQWVPQVSKCYG